MAKYKVIESRQINKLGPTGNSVAQYRVWIQTERGSTGAADIDAADWTADKLKEILGNFADDLDLAFTIQE